MLTAALAVLGYMAPPSVGLALYRRVLGGRSLLEGVAFAWGLGWMVVNLLMMATNQVLGVELSQAWILPMALIFIAVATLLLVPAVSWRNLRRVLRPRFSSEFSWTLIPLSVGPAILLAFLVLKAMQYPATGPDALFYHLYLPKLAFLTGSLPRSVSRAMVDVPNAFPNLLVTQQVWVYFTANSADQLLSRPMVPVYSVLTAVLLCTTCRRWGWSTGILAILLWASLETPLFMAFGNLSVEIWSDIPTAFYSLLSLHFLLRWLDSQKGAHISASGLFAAGATLTKYNGLLLVLGILLILLVLALRTFLKSPAEKASTARTALVPPLLFLVVAGVMSALLFIRNALLFGNPVYPFLTQYLGGINLEAEALLAFYELPPLDIKLIQSQILLSSLTFLLFFASVKLPEVSLRILQLLAGLYILPMLLLFQFETSFFRLIQPALPMVAIPAAVLLQRAVLEGGPPITVGTALASSGLALLLWPTPHLAVAVAVLAALGFAKVTRGRWRELGSKVAKPATAALLLVLSLSLVHPSMASASNAKYPTPTLGPIPVGLPEVEDDVVLRETLGFNWMMWTWMNENLPPGTRVMTLEINRYYVEVEFVSPASSLLVDHYYADTLEEAIAVLKQAEVEYVLEVPFFRSLRETKPFWERSPIFQSLHLEEYFELVHQEGDLELYRIKA